MSSAALTRREEEIASLRSRLSGIRRAAENESRSLQGKAVKAVSAFAWGAYQADRQRQNQAVPTVLGLDAEIAWGVGLYAAAKLTDGRAGELMEDASESLLTIYAYKRGLERR